jgi:hypothetical protein
MARERTVRAPGSHDALQQPPWEVVGVTAVCRREKTDLCGSLPNVKDLHALRSRGLHSYLFCVALATWSELHSERNLKRTERKCTLRDVQFASVV